MPTAARPSAPGPTDDGEAPADAVRTALLAPPGWLTAVTDGDRLAAELARVLPGSVGVAGCALLDLRARGPEWKVRYRVTLAGATDEPSEVVLVGRASPPVADPGAPSATGTPGGAGWRVTSPGLGLDLRAEVGDRRLPAAAVLLDPAAARALLEEGLAGASPGLRLAGCTATTVRYVVGARCTVVYRLQHDAGGGDEPDPDRPDAVVAKAHADGEGARVDAAMRSLWGSPLARGDVVRIARPLGYLPGPGVGLQEALPGDRTLRDVLAGIGRTGDAAPAVALLRSVADGLVALHGCGVADPPSRTWADDVDRARRTTARLEPTWPAAARALTRLLDALEERAVGTVPGDLRPAHGAFRPSQVLVDGDRIGFLDLDGFCLAEPERDVGRFTKSVAKALVPPGHAGPEAHRQARALGRTLTGVAVARYTASAPLDPARLALWEDLAVVAGLAHTAATLRPGAGPLLRMLEDLPLGRGEGVAR